MNNYWKLAVAVMMVFFSISLCSCGSEKDEPQYNPSAEKIKGTTWHYYKQVQHSAYKDKVFERDYYWTFLASPYDSQSYKLLIKGINASDLSWRFSLNPDSHRECLWLEQDNANAGLAMAICCSTHDIISWTENELILGNSTHEIYLERVSYDEFGDNQGGGSGNVTDDDDDDDSGNNNSGAGNNGGSSFEAPEIGFYDYTAYPTRLKVQFQILNHESAGVSRVKAYYGTSSASKSASASLSGRMITVNLSGLSKGTKYIVKVTASGPGGTASESVTCMTEY